MQRVFTDYVRQLDPSGEPPSRELFAQVWDALRRLVERELRRRGLWDAPPSYLGIYGRTRWWEGSGPSSGPGRDDGLDELVADLYPFVFVDRLDKLIDHLRTKPNIDGLVVLNLRHLLHERQKKHDPLGFRVFAVFHQAVVRAVAAEELCVLQGNVRIRNDTVLGHRPDAVPDHRLDAADEIVGTWNDVLMPDLVSGKGKAREWVVDSLQTFLRRLPASGIESFTFRQLLDPLKQDARIRWALHFEPAATGIEGDLVEDGRAAIVPIVGPESSVDDRNSLEQLDRCLNDSIRRLEPERGRDDLWILWRALRRRAQDDEIPSRRQLADELELPRRRLSKLFTTLGELVNDCRQSQLGASFVARSAAERETMDVKSRAEALRVQTGQARRRVAAFEDERHERTSRPIPGEIYSAAASDPHPVEWVLLRADERGFYTVPADTSPLVGTHDVVVPAEVVGGPLTLRLAFGLRLAASNFEGARRVGALPGDLLDLACERIGRPAGPVEDPELDEWIHDVVKPASDAMRASDAALRVADGDSRSGRGDDRRSRRGARSRWRDPIAVAASMLLVLCLGLGRRVLELDQTLDRHQETIERLEEEAAPKAGVNIPFKPLDLNATRSDRDTFVVPADAEDVVFLIDVFGLEESFERYRLRIRREDGNVDVWTSDPLKRVKGNTLTVSVPFSWLPRGEYRVSIYGITADGSDQFMTSSTLFIEPEASAEAATSRHPVSAP